MALPEGRQWLGVLLGVFGLVAIVGALAVGGWFLTEVRAAGYTHTVTPVDDDRCSAGEPPAPDRYDYANLSSAGKDVVDRAVADPGGTVRTGEPVEEFEYGDAADPAPPQYVSYEDECYRLTAVEFGFGSAGELLRSSVLAGLAFVAAVGVIAVVVAWFIYRRNA